MKSTLVDSTVLLDVGTEDPKWLDWSTRMLAECAGEAPLVINPVIFAEMSVGYGSVEETDAAFPLDVFTREQLPWDAAFLVGKVFVRYRKHKRTAPVPLPDFFIAPTPRFAGCGSSRATRTASEPTSRPWS